MSTNYGPIINLVSLGLAALITAWGAVQLLSDRPASSLVFFAVALGVWGVGRAIVYALGGSKAAKKK